MPLLDVSLLKERVDYLERRIEDLERRPQFVPQYVPYPIMPYPNMPGGGTWSPTIPCSDPNKFYSNSTSEDGSCKCK
jgi:hypothetical protein